MGIVIRRVSLNFSASRWVQINADGHWMIVDNVYLKHFIVFKLMVLPLFSKT